MRYLKILSFTALLIASLSVSACETIHGAGQDIEHAGEHVQDAAR